MPSACPPGLPETVTCWRGQDPQGAHLLIARPRDWNGRLVVHVHGGPRMAPPNPHTSDEDLLRHAEFLAEGWAFAATSRRRAGFGVRRAGEDTLSARQEAESVLGRPRLTVLHGQSWGGAVAAKAIETLNDPGPDGRRPFDAALLTNGVLAGATRAYDMRVDLRAAFQAVCGGPSTDRRPREEVIGRFLACTGADLAPDARTATQRQALADLAAASRIPDWAIPGHLWWGSQIFPDIAEGVAGGGNPFGNAAVRYRGTSDDAAFNAAVPRTPPDAAARARLAADGDPVGRIALPVLTLHGTGDATVFVEHEAAYRATLERAGTAGLLAQVFVDENDHQKMSPVLYPPALRLLAEWAEGGTRPTPESFHAACEALRPHYAGDCRVLRDYVPQPWEARVNPRQPPDTVAGR
jgi:alpha-beta hydrolase superfamily lysophospholipase